MALGIMQGIGEQIGTMIGGPGAGGAYGYFGTQGPNLRGGGIQGAYTAAKNWLGVGYSSALRGRHTREQLMPWLRTVGVPGVADMKLSNITGPSIASGGAGIWGGPLVKREFTTFARDAASIFRRRQIAAGIGGGIGLIAAGKTVGYGNMLKGGGMWAAGSVIGGALGATGRLSGGAAAGRQIGGRIGLGIFGGYKAAKWGGSKLGLW